VSTEIPRLLAMTSPFREQNHTLHLLEPLDSCQESLWKSLFDRTYSRPFIIDSGLERRLQFDLHTIQSSMHRERPDTLMLPYTRKMMAFLLFNRTPVRILLLGLGGGSLAKFCYRQLPSTAVTAVEVNSDVIALRNEFYIPNDDVRFRVIRANGADYVACPGPSKDVILADACDREGVAPELDTTEFYQDAHRRLFAGGVFVANVCGDPEHSAAHVDRIRAVFGEGIMTLQVRPDGNLIVIAFKDRRPPIDWQKLDSIAADLRRKFGLDFPKYVRRIALNWKLRQWRRALS
jgi:spermidine synthase